tara:strand:- start:25 stop:633 length:609 start_codon:yes stop_codon:yes gene_type:complete
MSDFVQVKNFITDDECNDLIKFYDTYFSVQHHTNQHTDVFNNKSFQYEVIANQYQKSYARYLMDRIRWGIVNELRKFYNDDRFIYNDYCDLVRWKVGEGLNWHADANYYPSGEPNYVSYRTYGSVTYLNDDYEGGEFEFMNEKYGKIKPEKGMMIAFPADLDWVHRVNTVTKGDRYTMASWYTDDKSHWNYVNEGWSGTIGV